MSDSPTTPAALLTIPEVAHRLHLSERTCWSFAKDGRLRAVKIGRSVRVDPEDLAQFIEGAKIGGAQ